MLKMNITNTFLLLMILSGESYANFVGNSSGMFLNPDPTCGINSIVCSGSGTDTLTWGDPAAGSQASQVRFVGEANINAAPYIPTTWGTLYYTNGATFTGTSINSFALRISFDPDDTSTITDAPAVSFNFSINSTVNQDCATNDRTCLENNADWLIWNTVTWTSGGLEQTLSASNYLLSCKAQGCKQDTIFKVLEEGSTGVEIMGKFGSAIPFGFGDVLNPEVGFLATIPEPNTPQLLLLGIMGLFYSLRRESK